MYPRCVPNFRSTSISEVGVESDIYFSVSTSRQLPVKARGGDLVELNTWKPLLVAKPLTTNHERFDLAGVTWHSSRTRRPIGTDPTIRALESHFSRYFPVNPVVGRAPSSRSRREATTPHTLGASKPPLCVQKSVGLEVLVLHGPGCVLRRPELRKRACSSRYIAHIPQFTVANLN